jgi:L-asparagine transporter-like permease
MVAVSQIRLRQMRERNGVPEPALRMWLFPWASYATILGMVGILVAMALTPDAATQLYFSLVALVAACIGYAVVRSRRAGLTPHGSIP